MTPPVSAAIIQSASHLSAAATMQNREDATVSLPFDPASVVVDYSNVFGDCARSPSSSLRVGGAGGGQR